MPSIILHSIGFVKEIFPIVVAYFKLTKKPLRLRAEGFFALTRSLT